MNVISDLPDQPGLVVSDHSVPDTVLQTVRLNKNTTKQFVHIIHPVSLIRFNKGEPYTLSYYTVP